ncbi:hypothetical protein [Pseudescherichia sp.]|uniref:hypothetical protein n=1 Tax=Pseudescherichia sp. TaxID=2055881 RepID=UPI00289F2F60|nr:hypothetical protein [Pseudescherichia sp.]
MNAWKYAGEWEENDIAGNNYAGFIYMFRFPESGQVYYGSKQIYKRVKDASKIKPTSVENGWREYSSSSSLVNRLIDEGAIYERIILWAFPSMNETLLAELSLIACEGLHPLCLNYAVMHKCKLPGSTERLKIYNIMQEVRTWLR